MSTVHQQKFEAKITSRSQGEYPPKQDIVWYMIRVLNLFLWLYKLNVRTPSPVPLFIYFHTSSMTLLEKCTGPTPVQQHQSHTSLEHPWYTNWFYFISSFRGLEPQTPCQAPGLGSFIANVILSQVHVRNRIVDFQCFGKGLWTKTMTTNSWTQLYNIIRINLQESWLEDYWRLIYFRAIVLSTWPTYNSWNQVHVYTCLHQPMTWSINTTVWWPKQRESLPQDVRCHDTKGKHVQVQSVS